MGKVSPPVFALVLGAVWLIRAPSLLREPGGRWMIGVALVYCATLSFTGEPLMLQWYPVLMNALLMACRNKHMTRVVTKADLDQPLGNDPVQLRLVDAAPPESGWAAIDRLLAAPRPSRAITLGETEREGRWKLSLLLPLELTHELSSCCGPLMMRSLMPNWRQLEAGLCSRPAAPAAPLHTYLDASFHTPSAHSPPPPHLTASPPPIPPVTGVAPNQPTSHPRPAAQHTQPIPSGPAPSPEADRGTTGAAGPPASGLSSQGTAAAGSEPDLGSDLNQEVRSMRSGIARQQQAVRALQTTQRFIKDLGWAVPVGAPASQLQQRRQPARRRSSNPGTNSLLQVGVGNPPLSRSSADRVLSSGSSGSRPIPGSASALGRGTRPQPHDRDDRGAGSSDDDDVSLMEGYNSPGTVHRDPLLLIGSPTMALGLAMSYDPRWNVAQAKQRASAMAASSALSQAPSAFSGAAASGPAVAAGAGSQTLPQAATHQHSRSEAFEQQQQRQRGTPVRVLDADKGNGYRHSFSGGPLLDRRNSSASLPQAGSGVGSKREAVIRSYSQGQIRSYSQGQILLRLLGGDSDGANDSGQAWNADLESDGQSSFLQSPALSRNSSSALAAPLAVDLVGNFRAHRSRVTTGLDGAVQAAISGSVGQQTRSPDVQPYPLESKGLIGAEEGHEPSLDELTSHDSKSHLAAQHPDMSLGGESHTGVTQQSVSPSASVAQSSNRTSLLNPSPQPTPLPMHDDGRSQASDGGQPVPTLSIPVLNVTSEPNSPLLPATAIAVGPPPLDPGFTQRPLSARTPILTPETQLLYKSLSSHPTPSAVVNPPRTLGIPPTLDVSLMGPASPALPPARSASGSSSSGAVAGSRARIQDPGRAGRLAAEEGGVTAVRPQHRFRC
ncbi:MAG: hypothetical protein WDW36_001344 [Sanguina aurantia]